MVNEYRCATCNFQGSIQQLGCGHWASCINFVRARQAGTLPEKGKRQLSEWLESLATKPDTESPIPNDVADTIIDYLEELGCRVEIWQANFIRQWWGTRDERRNLCVKCHRPTDSGETLCAICKHEPAAL